MTGMHHHTACPLRGCSYNPLTWDEEHGAIEDKEVERRLGLALATTAPQENGWEELRREIEALPECNDGTAGEWSLVERRAVLAIVDRLAAARGEPGLREAASDLVRAFTDLLHEDTAEAWQRAQDHAAALRAALATPGAGWGNGNSWDDLTSVGKEHRREQAAAIAAEYDRLGSE